MSAKRRKMKSATINTLKGLVRELKVDALHSGRYPAPVDPNMWEQRDKSRAVRCIAYNRDVRHINALEDAIFTLENTTTYKEEPDVRPQILPNTDG